MGVERAVTRWYVQRQALLEEIASLEAQLASDSNAPDSGAPSTQESDDRARQLARAREKLRALGSCPKPMMG
jgi:cell division septum initiation protein DivIVA